MSVCAHCVGLHLLSVAACLAALSGALSVGLHPSCRSAPASCPFPPSSLTGQQGRAALSVGLRPLCQSAPASCPFLLSHPSSRRLPRGWASFSVGLRPLCRSASSFGPILLPSPLAAGPLASPTVHCVSLLLTNSCLLSGRHRCVAARAVTAARGERLSWPDGQVTWSGPSFPGQLGPTKFGVTGEKNVLSRQSVTRSYPDPNLPRQLSRSWIEPSHYCPLLLELASIVYLSIARGCSRTV